MKILSERCPTTNQKGKNMSRFKRLSHTIWQCEYHINCEVQEIKVQADHVHLSVQIPLKLATSE
jgi:REP element-mobilizing transposase RayT